MSLVLVRLSNQYATRTASVPVTAPPFSVSGWIKANDITTVHHMFFLIDAADGNHYFAIRLAGNIGGDPVQIQARDGGGPATGGTGSGYSAATWHNVIGIFATTTSRTIYIDGGNSDENTESITPSSIAKIHIGAGKAAAEKLDGKVAEVGIWDVALSGASIAALAAGAYPDDIESGDLVAYYPLLSDSNDNAGSYHLTDVGSPAYDGADLPPMAGGEPAVGSPVVQIMMQMDQFNGGTLK